MIIIMPNAARLTLPQDLSRKKNGTPMSAAIPKQISCRFVRLKNTFDFTLVRSRGTGIYAANYTTSISGSSILSGASFPQTSQPSVFCRAKSSIRGTSPISSTILSLVISGFLLCCSTGEMINWCTDAELRFGFPFFASRHTSAFPLVQNPSP